MLKDYFGSEIEIGDEYFYGSPPTFGRVIVIKRSRIVLDIGVTLVWNKDLAEVNQTMNCKSPEKGICLDKIPEDRWQK